MMEAELRETFLALTPTQFKVLFLLLADKSDAEIGAKLGGIVEATVRKHIQALCDRFAIARKFPGLNRNRRQGLIDLKQPLNALFEEYQEQLGRYLSPLTEVNETTDESQGRSEKFSALPTKPTSETIIEFPEGLVPLNSPFYIERPPLEERCYEAIERPYALIRIKAPQQMGKTSLIMRILEKAKNAGCRKAYIDFMAVNQGIFQNPDKFLRWFCGKVERELELQSKFEEYWDGTILSSNDNCTAYFEEYLLKKVDSLALGLDAIDRIFPHREVAQDFFGLLRTWHEYGKNNAVWNKFRIVVAHSTEVDVIDIIPDIHKSPFNVGLSIELSELTESQVELLARRHNLNLDNHSIANLMNMVGGHPYLIRLALYHISQNNLTIKEILAQSPTDEGIYRKHLQRHLGRFESAPDLEDAFKSILENKNLQIISRKQLYGLLSMGLVKVQNNTIAPRCDLYCKYFRNVWDRKLWRI
ncbi:MAG: AAA-like domain-containing protein [Cyanobacteria bacterium SBLK]|nr:AAA-like domain-containing protein [Cyanobacteria bacterium SBLK]